MGGIQPEGSSNEVAIASSAEQDVDAHPLCQTAQASGKFHAETGTELGADVLSSIIDLASISVGKIEALIAELQSKRNHLQSEANAFKTRRADM